MSTNTQANTDDTTLIEEAIIAQFGERCPDFDPDCHCCRVWRALDDLRAERAAGAKAIHDAVMAERPKLQPIATAPDLERVMVAGWNPPTKRVEGYWWYEEDCVSDGKAIAKPFATHWFPIVKPVFPAAPKAGG